MGFWSRLLGKAEEPQEIVDPEIHHSDKPASMTVPDIIGMPGGMTFDGGGEGMSEAYPVDTYNAAALSLPILTIEPKKANYEAGAELYKLEDAAEYKAFLQDNDINLTGDVLKVACHALSNPSETYSNSFSPNSIAESISSIGSENLQDLMFMGGTSKIVGDNSVVEKMKSSDNDFISGAGGVVEAGANLVKSLRDSLDKIGGEKVKKLTHLISKVANQPGSKIDFPLMWRSSNYSASYTVTTRLYNPCPADDDMYSSLIVASLGALIALAVPCSDDGDLYHWPFICKCYIPGLFRMNAGYVSNITVSKGGDAMDVSLQSKGWMRPNLIDVQITFSSLYSVLPMTKLQEIKDRPTLYSEIDALLSIDEPPVPVVTGSSASNSADPSTDRVRADLQAEANALANAG